MRNTLSLTQAGRVLSHQDSATGPQHAAVRRTFQHENSPVSLTVTCQSSPFNDDSGLQWPVYFPSPGHLVQENVHAATRVQASW